MRVVSVETLAGESRNAAVFNLNVAAAPEFYANGVLVHNSCAALRYGVMSRPEASIPGQRSESDDPRRAFLDRVLEREREGYYEPENIYINV